MKTAAGVEVSLIVVGVDCVAAVCVGGSAIHNADVGVWVFEIAVEALHIVRIKVQCVGTSQVWHGFGVEVSDAGTTGRGTQGVGHDFDMVVTVGCKSREV